MTYAEQLKDLLSEPNKRIKLHDLVVSTTRQMASEIGGQEFRVDDQNTVFESRLKQYEKAVGDLLVAEALIGRWGGSDQREIGTIPLRRLASEIGPVGGFDYLILARWYPVFLLLYAGSIGGVCGNNYETLHDLAHIRVPNQDGHLGEKLLVTAAFRAMGAVHDYFKRIPTYERKRTPRSDYICALLQPELEEFFYLGSTFEDVFDRVEVLFAVEYAHMDHPDPVAQDDQVWAPIGRFGWRTERPNSLVAMMTEASNQGAKWPPARAGLFGGSSNRFIELAEGISRILRRWRFE